MYTLFSAFIKQRIQGEINIFGKKGINIEKSGLSDRAEKKNKNLQKFLSFLLTSAIVIKIKPVYAVFCDLCETFVFFAVR